MIKVGRRGDVMGGHEPRDENNLQKLEKSRQQGVL